MDAKKAAKVKEPFQFTKTKAFKALNLVFAGLVVYSVLGGIAYYAYSKKDRHWFRDNAIDRYFESKEYLLNVERAKGKAPPTREQIMTFWEKNMKDKHYEASRPNL